MGIFDRMMTDDVKPCGRGNILEIVSVCQDTAVDILDALLRQVLARFPESALNMKRLDAALRVVITKSGMTTACMTEMVCVEKRFNCELASSRKVHRFKTLEADAEFKQNVIDKMDCAEHWVLPSNMLPASVVKGLGFAGLPLTDKLRKMEKNYKDMCLADMVLNGDVNEAKKEKEAAVTKRDTHRKAIQEAEKAVKEYGRNGHLTDDDDMKQGVALYETCWRHRHGDLALTREATFHSNKVMIMERGKNEANAILKKRQSLTKTGDNPLLLTLEEEEELKGGLVAHMKTIQGINGRRREQYNRLLASIESTGAKFESHIEFLAAGVKNTNKRDRWGEAKKVFDGTTQPGTAIATAKKRCKGIIATSTDPDDETAITAAVGAILLVDDVLRNKIACGQMTFQKLINIHMDGYDSEKEEAVGP